MDSEIPLDRMNFIKLTFDKTKFDKKNLREAFGTFDRDGNGEIDASELKYIFGSRDVDLEVWHNFLNE